MTRTATMRDLRSYIWPRKCRFPPKSGRSAQTDHSYQTGGNAVQWWVLLDRLFGATVRVKSFYADAVSINETVCAVIV